MKKHEYVTNFENISKNFYQDENCASWKNFIAHSGSNWLNEETVASINVHNLWVFPSSLLTQLQAEGDTNDLNTSWVMGAEGEGWKPFYFYTFWIASPLGFLSGSATSCLLEWILSHLQRIGGSCPFPSKIK